MLFNSESVGFHGTSRLAMGRILKREIIRSDQNFEWLGTGFYVWQDSPWLARQWARMRHSELADVVAVHIDLAGCLDLFNPRWQWELLQTDADLVAAYLAEGRAVPVNRGAGFRARDCETINRFCEEAEASGLPMRSVRAIFEEGEAIFEASAIRTRSHVQVAVRDLSTILELEEIDQ